MMFFGLGMITLSGVRLYTITSYSTDQPATYKRTSQDYMNPNKSSEGISHIIGSIFEGFNDNRTTLALEMKLKHEVLKPNALHIIDGTENSRDLYSKNFEANNHSENVLYPKEKEYLIDTPTCRIPYFDPYDASIVDALRQLKTLSCPPREILTYVIKNELFINWTATFLSPYQGAIHYCSYVEIFRPKNKETHHNFVSTNGKRYPFYNSIKVQHDFILVSCFDKK